ncbi:MAG: hypothetical protein H6684_04205 [Deltaproteobacteria bacterium]|nr:hypothetical protein [bacterium]MCB9487916.1 hypothetical protein [Deltaproteobacteria bacterium]
MSDDHVSTAPSAGRHTAKRGRVLVIGVSAAMLVFGVFVMMLGDHDSGYDSLGSEASLHLSDLVGTYEVTGVNPDSGDSYQMILAISRNGDVLRGVWTWPSGKQADSGVGVILGNKVAFNFGNGVVIFERTLEGDLRGNWTNEKFDRVGTETAHRMQ